MPHMPATGVSGLDLYVRADDGQLAVAGHRPADRSVDQHRRAGQRPARPEARVPALPAALQRRQLGRDRRAEGSTLAQARTGRPSGKKPIVFYGTSITQGGCASRPGMVHTAILGRRLDWPVINLGFSGNGTMDLEVAESARRDRRGVYVLDCLPNMTAARGRGAGGAVRPCAAARLGRKMPIVLVEDRTRPTPCCCRSVRRQQRGQPGGPAEGVRQDDADRASAACTTSPATSCWAMTARRPWTARTRPTWDSSARPRYAAG